MGCPSIHIGKLQGELLESKEEKRREVMKAKKVRKLMLSSLLMSSMVLGNAAVTMQVHAEEPEVSGENKDDPFSNEGENTEEEPSESTPENGEIVEGEPGENTPENGEIEEEDPNENIPNEGESVPLADAVPVVENEPEEEPNETGIQVLADEEVNVEWTITPLTDVKYPTADSSQTAQQYVQGEFDKQGKSSYANLMGTEGENLLAGDTNIVATVFSVSRFSLPENTSLDQVNVPVMNSGELANQTVNSVVKYGTGANTRYSIKLDGKYSDLDKDSTYIFWAGQQEGEWLYVGRAEDVTSDSVRFTTNQINDGTVASGSYIVVQLKTVEAKYKVTSTEVSSVYNSQLETLMKDIVKNETVGFTDVSNLQVRKAYVYKSSVNTNGTGGILDVEIPSDLEKCTNIVILQEMFGLDENGNTTSTWSAVNYDMPPYSWITLYQETKNEDGTTKTLAEGTRFLMVGIDTTKYSYDDASSSEANINEVKNLMSDKTKVTEYAKNSQYEELKAKADSYNVTADVLYVLDLVQSTVTGTVTRATEFESSGNGPFYGENEEMYKWGLNREGLGYRITLEDDSDDNGFTTSDYVGILRKDSTGWTLLNVTLDDNGILNFYTDSLSTFAIVKFNVGDKIENTDNNTASTVTTNDYGKITVPAGYTAAAVPDKDKSDATAFKKTLLTEDVIDTILKNEFYKDLVNPTVGDVVAMVDINSTGDGPYTLSIENENILSGHHYIIIHKVGDTWEYIVPSEHSGNKLTFTATTLSPFAVVELKSNTTNSSASTNTSTSTNTTSTASTASTSNTSTTSGVATGDATSLVGMAMWAATGMVSGLGAAFARKRKKK
jgi:hypothetical protein